MQRYRPEAGSGRIGSDRWLGASLGKHLGS